MVEKQHEFYLIGDFAFFDAHSVMDEVESATPETGRWCGLTDESVVVNYR